MNKMFGKNMCGAAAGFRPDLWPFTVCLVVHIKITGTVGPKVSQQNTTQSSTVCPLACLLPLEHPGPT